MTHAASLPPLRDMLRQNDLQTMLENARLTAAAPASRERMEEASRQIHQTMYRAALGQVTEEERRTILTILRPCCPEMLYSQAISTWSFHAALTDET